MGPKIHIKHTFRLIFIALMLAVTALLFFAPMETFAANQPVYNPGDSNFPFNPGATPNPNDNFPYAQEGLEGGLNIAEDNLPGGIQKQDSFVQLALGWINYFLQFYIFVAVGIIIYFGVQILISRDKTDKRKEAVTAIVNIAIGTLLIFFAYAIVIAIVNLVNVDEFKTNTGAVAPPVSSTDTPTANLYASAPVTTPVSTTANGISNVSGVFYGDTSSVLHWTIAVPSGAKVVGYDLYISNDNFATQTALYDAFLRTFVLDYNATSVDLTVTQGAQDTKIFPFEYKRGNEYRFKVKARVLLPTGKYDYPESGIGIIK